MLNQEVMVAFFALGLTDGFKDKLDACYGLNVSPKFICWHPYSQGDDTMGADPLSVRPVLLGKRPCVPSCPVRTQRENRHLGNMKQALGRHWIYWCLEPGLKASELGETNSCCLAATSLRCLAGAAGKDRDDAVTNILEFYGVKACF